MNFVKFSYPSKWIWVRIMCWQPYKSIVSESLTCLCTVVLLFNPRRAMGFGQVINGAPSHPSSELTDSRRDCSRFYCPQNLAKFALCRCGGSERARSIKRGDWWKPYIRHTHYLDHDELSKLLLDQWFRFVGSYYLIRNHLDSCQRLRSPKF